MTVLVSASEKAKPAQTHLIMCVPNSSWGHEQCHSHGFDLQCSYCQDCQQGSSRWRSSQRAFASVMSVTAMQIAVACGWICLLNVLTILALKVMNRESHASPHKAGGGVPCSYAGITSHTVVLCY